MTTTELPTTDPATTTETAGDWHQTACILCSINCGIEVKLDGRRFARIRGDKAHPASAGYTCEKALRLDYYQNDPHRLTAPLRRRADGTFEEIDWDTAIAEVAARLVEIRDTHGGEPIFYYGGGGQGNHLGGAYGPRDRAPPSGSVYSVERARAGEDGRVLGRRPALRAPPLSHGARLRARRGRGVRRQEPVAVARVPARPDDPQGDRQRSGAHDGRDRPAPHRDRGARRLPPPGATRHRRVLPRGAAGGARAGGPVRLGVRRRSAPPAPRSCCPSCATSRSPTTASAPASPRPTSAPSLVASPRRRASPSSRTSASSRRRTARSTRTSRSCSTCSSATSAGPGTMNIHTQFASLDRRRARERRRADDSRSAAPASSPGSFPATRSPTRSSPTTPTASGR